MTLLSVKFVCRNDVETPGRGSLSCRGRRVIRIVREADWERKTAGPLALGCWCVFPSPSGWARKTAGPLARKADTTVGSENGLVVGPESGGIVYE